MTTVFLLTIYCLVVMLGSWAGGWLPLVLKFTHTRMQLALSFVGGTMLGVGLLHLLPHAFYALGSINHTVAWLLAGFLLMFFIERVFQFHHHDPAIGPDAPEHHHGCDHDHHGEDHAHADETKSSRAISWPAALAGLALHSVMDGIALAAGVFTEVEGNAPPVAAGFVVFLVVALHKPLDSMTLGTLLALAGLPRGKRRLLNFLYALTVPLGVLLFMLGVNVAGEAHQAVIGCALAFAGGTFLCISTSDLLPELQFHAHDRLKLSAALLLGIAFSAGLVAIEEMHHVHDHGEHEAHEHHEEHGHHDMHGH